MLSRLQQKNRGTSAEEKERHRIKQLSAEKHNRGIAEKEARKRSSVDTLEQAAKQQRLHVLPWDETANLERLKMTSSQYKALCVRFSSLFLAFHCQLCL